MDWMRRLEVALLTAIPAIVTGFGGATEAGQTPRPERDADFLFGRPRGYLGARGAWFMPAASSDIYDFLNETLTIEKRDFDAPLLGIDAGFAIHPRVDVLVGFEISRASMTSEYRDFEDENGLPIVQETKLTIVPLTGNLKLYLTPRGREVSRYAYVPAKVRPYVGGGGGFVWYELQQSGDFVDFVDLTIFTSAFRSSGWGLAAQAFGGVEVALDPRWFLSFEGRYLWGDADLSQDFLSFESIDLSGARLGAGVHFSF